ncbi:hypothetical protein RF263_05555, partial [Acinetobacter baumannii]|nr:hypothetical protein [Acinetobacter baumannii]
LKAMNTEKKLLQEKINQTAQDLLMKQSEVDQADGIFRSLENRKNVLEQLMKNPFNNQAGIRSIMDHQKSLHG